jgi:hypothetical protein
VVTIAAAIHLVNRITVVMAVAAVIAHARTTTSVVT